jgi:hypothetical protein
MEFYLLVIDAIIGPGFRRPRSNQFDNSFNIFLFTHEVESPSYQPHPL